MPFYREAGGRPPLSNSAAPADRLAGLARAYYERDNLFPDMDYRLFSRASWGLRIRRQNPGVGAVFVRESLAFIEAACLPTILARAGYVACSMLTALHQAAAGVRLVHLFGEVNSGAGIFEFAELLPFAVALASACGAAAVFPDLLILLSPSSSE